MLATPRLERQILRVADLIAQLNLSRTTIWRMRRAGEFPQPIRLSANTVGWPAHVIDEMARRAPPGMIGCPSPNRSSRKHTRHAEQDASEPGIRCRNRHRRCHPRQLLSTLWQAPPT